MAYSAAYLGTDTVETIYNYLGTPRGETLSYVMDRIFKPRPHGVGVRNRTARVYNGPVTDGSNFYDIMAQGVADMLPTIADGERVINIIGHSRGAVESIIASHELARIQKVLCEAADTHIGSEEQLFELLCDSEHKETKEHFKKKLSPYTAALFANVSVLRENMAELEVNLCLLDPVPGGRVMGFSVAQVKDERYYQIPPIVKDCREILLENERTRGFKAIVPHALDPQKTTFTLMNLPGHHGTASGNPYDQCLNTTDYSKLKTKEVQDITLYALYDFFTAHGVRFDSDYGQRDNDLTVLFENYRDADPQEKQNIKLATYAIILINKSAYTAFNQTSYVSKWLLHGQEGSVQSYSTLGMMSLNHDRLIHVGGSGDSSLKSIVSFQSEQFVNAVHARLFLRNELQLTEEQTPVESLKTILDNFDNNIGSIQSILSEHDTQGKLTQKIKSSIQMMLSGLVQTYLRNNLSDEAKADILAVIQRAINIEIQSDRQAELTQLVQGLKLYLMDNLSEDLHALTVSHQQDVFNLLSCDERNIKIFDDKIYQLEQFKMHLEILTKYFQAFKHVQPKLMDNQNVLEKSLTLLASRRDALMKDKQQHLILSGLHDRALSRVQAQKEANRLLNAKNQQLQVENSGFKIKSAQLRVDNIELLEENNHIHQELEARKTKLEFHHRRLVDLEAGLVSQDENNRALLAEKISVEGERDVSQAKLEASNTQLDNKIQRIAEFEEIFESPDSDALFQGLNLEILGGFALVLGVAVVAIALTALMLTPVAPLVPVGIALAGAGLATAGFFGLKQGILQQHQEELYERIPEVSV
tara:strand:- start:16179 stop:18623 length:2445 start_codon:yes stop_codon:yes gene_type:complete